MKKRKAPSKIGLRIFELFPEKSAVGIGRILGIARNTVQGWKTGKSKPTISQLEVVVKHSGCSWHWLMTGEGELVVDAKAHHEELIAQLNYYQRKLDIAITQSQALTGNYTSESCGYMPPEMFDKIYLKMVELEKQLGWEIE